MRRQRRQRAFCLARSRIGLTYRQKGTAAAQRASGSGGGRQVNLITAGGEHRDRGTHVLRFEIAVEGVGKQDDFSPRRLAGGYETPLVITEIVLSPLRQRPLRG